MFFKYRFINSCLGNKWEKLDDYSEALNLKPLPIIMLTTFYLGCSKLKISIVTKFRKCFNTISVSFPSFSILFIHILYMQTYIY